MVEVSTAFFGHETTFKGDLKVSRPRNDQSHTVVTRQIIPAPENGIEQVRVKPAGSEVGGSSSGKMALRWSGSASAAAIQVRSASSEVSSVRRLLYISEKMQSTCSEEVIEIVCLLTD